MRTLTIARAARTVAIGVLCCLAAPQNASAYRIKTSNQNSSMANISSPWVYCNSISSNNRICTWADSDSGAVYTQGSSTIWVKTSAADTETVIHDEAWRRQNDFLDYGNPYTGDLCDCYPYWISDGTVVDDE